MLKPQNSNRLSVPRGPNPASILTSCVTLGNSLHLSESRFLLGDVEPGDTYFRGLCEDFTRESTVSDTSLDTQVVVRVCAQPHTTGFVLFASLSPRSLGTLLTLKS